MADQRLILIVDDDYDFLEINRHILERAGYRVVTAGSPSQAMERVAARPPPGPRGDPWQTRSSS